VPLEADSSFVTAQLQVDRGRHTLSCGGRGFNAYVYGYGIQESFGYNAGTKIQDLSDLVQASSNLWLYLLLGGVAVAGIGLYVVRRKKAIE
jgi:LPXTG-motif cell wall-anchored protein